MKKYFVEIPITGYVSVEIEANSKEEAIEKAWESPDLSLDNVVEWEAHEYISKGNVSYAVRDEIDVYSEDE